MTPRFFLTLSVPLLVLCSGALAQSRDTLSHHLLAHYPFDKNADDLSIYQNNGINEGAIPANDRTGTPDGAFYFYGVNQHVRIPKAHYTPFLGDFTVSFWFKTDADERIQAFSLGPLGEDNFDFDLNPRDGLWVFWNGGGQPGILSSVDVFDNRWHHIALTRMDSTLSLYLDGEFQGDEISNGPIGSNADILFGGRNSFPWNGCLDDLKIYSLALSPSYIKEWLFKEKVFLENPSEETTFITRHHTTIRWKEDNTDLPVQVELSTDNGTTWQKVATSTGNEARWAVPKQAAHAACFLRIVRDGSVLATSDRFYIRAPAMERTYSWHKVYDDGPFLPKDGVQAVVHKDSVWLLGGWNPNLYDRASTNEVWKSADGENWTYDDTAAWEVRHRFGAFDYQNALWVIGGDPNQGRFQMDVWRLFNGGSAWRREVTELPMMERAGHMVTLFNGKMWLAGGQQFKSITIGRDTVDIGIDTVFNDVWTSTDGVKWSNVIANAEWTGRSFGGLIEFNNKLWLAGGGNYNRPRKFYNDIWFSQNGVEWRQAPVAPWRPRCYHEVIAFDGKMWVLGGYGDNERNLNDVWFTEDGHSWTELKASPWMPKHAATSFVFDGSLWLGMGSTGNHPSMLENDLWRLNPRLEINLSENGPKILNKGDSLSLWTESVAGAKYQWFRDSLKIPHDTLNRITVKQEGKYFLEVTEAGGVTGKSATVQILFHDLELLVSGNQPPLIGDTLLITARGTDGAILEWYHNGEPMGNTSPTIMVTDDGSYFITLQFPEGIQYSDTIEVDFLPKLTLMVSDSILFLGNSATLEVESYEGLSYQWFRDGVKMEKETNNWITTLLAGTYFVRASNQAGNFSFSSEKRISHKKPTLKLGVLPYSDIQYLKVIYDICDDCSIIWSNNKLPISESNTDSIAILDPGTYSAQITDQKTLSAVATDTVAVSVKVDSNQVFIVSNGLDQTMTFILNSKTLFGALSLTLLSIDGKSYWSWSARKDGELFYKTYYTDNVPPGIFIAVVSIANKKFIKRIVSF